MRKLSAGLFYSLDGVAQSPNLWQFDSFDDELGAGLDSMMQSVDAGILGRVSYEEWAGYWPNASQDQDFAGFINTLPKFVASRTLPEKLEWENSRLIQGPLEDFVQQLKDTEGGDVNVFGSISVVRQLLFAGLLDSLTLMIHPVIAASGKHLFEEGDPVTRLELQDSQRTSKGNMILSYGLRSS
ncbi:dihydrofolate reductase family protein [Arthrobacter sp.]|uniref:dihydrofolate reductase family protein n=1 Tax=Arthrobacter sp. TaxID=1667 RepID=UPI0028127C94|nr:dihydrofolate reductase family protein [Arthrobacter sp.]